MSLTINTAPNNIDNSAAYNVTTSLVEIPGSVNNLRVRADVYHEGIIKAVVEKPKGIPDFDFGDILKSLTPGLGPYQGSWDIVESGSIGANLITNWSVSSGSFDINSTSGNTITRLQRILATNAFLKSNNITVAIGELYLLYSPDYSSNGGAPNAPLFYYPLCVSQYQYGGFVKNQSILIMPTVNGTMHIEIGNTIGEFDFGGTFYLYKITTDRSVIGNLLAPYFVNFTEVWENSSGVTTTGTTFLTKVFRYVPAKGDGTAFSNYVLSGSTSKFACNTLNNNAVKQFALPNFNNQYAYLLCFFTEYVELEMIVNRNTVSYFGQNFSCYEGWGVMALIYPWSPYFGTPAGGYITYRIYDSSGVTPYSALLTVNCDLSQIDERVVLEFDGLLGGKEYLAFEGIKEISLNTIRSYYLNNKKTRKGISFAGIKQQLLETCFKDMTATTYLESLMISDNVKRLEASYAAPTEVTIVTDKVTETKGVEMFTNQITIEYEY